MAYDSRLFLDDIRKKSPLNFISISFCDSHGDKKYLLMLVFVTLCLRLFDLMAFMVLVDDVGCAFDGFMLSLEGVWWDSLDEGSQVIVFGYFVIFLL